MRYLLEAVVDVATDPLLCVLVFAGLFAGLVYLAS